MIVIISLIALGFVALVATGFYLKFGRSLKKLVEPEYERNPSGRLTTRGEAQKNKYDTRLGDLKAGRSFMRVAIAVAIIGVVTLTLLQSIKVVGANEVGVAVTLGRIDRDPVSSGPALVAPWTDVEKLPTRPKTYTFDVPVRTNEQGDATINLQVRWATDRTKAPDLYLQARTGEEETIETEIVNVQGVAAAVNVLGKKTNVEVVNGSEWTKNSKEIQRDLAARLTRFGVIVAADDVQIKAVHPSEETQAAIDRLAAQVNETKIATQSKLTAIEQAAQQKEAANGLVAAAKLLGQITPEQRKLLELQAGERIMNKNAENGLPTYTLPGQNSSGVGVLAGAN